MTGKVSASSPPRPSPMQNLALALTSLLLPLRVPPRPGLVGCFPQLLATGVREGAAHLGAEALTSTIRTSQYGCAAAAAASHAPVSFACTSHLALTQPPARVNARAGCVSAQPRWRGARVRGGRPTTRLARAERCRVSGGRGSGLCLD